MGPVVFAVVAAQLVALLPLLGVVWKAATVVTRTERALERLERDVEDFKEGKAALGQIEPLSKKVDALADAQTRFRDKFSGYPHRLHTLEAVVFPTRPPSPSSSDR